jgi:hypothetical protein
VLRPHSSDLRADLANSQPPWTKRSVLSAAATLVYARLNRRGYNQRPPGAIGGKCPQWPVGTLATCGKTVPCMLGDSYASSDCCSMSRGTRLKKISSCSSSMQPAIKFPSPPPRRHQEDRLAPSQTPSWFPIACKHASRCCKLATTAGTSGRQLAVMATTVDSLPAMLQFERHQCMLTPMQRPDRGCRLIKRAASGSFLLTDLRQAVASCLQRHGHSLNQAAR